MERVCVLGGQGIEEVGRVLLLAGGIPQAVMADCFRRRGYVVIMVDYNELPPGKLHADYYYQESTLDVKSVAEIAKREQVDLIATCCTDQAVATMSTVSEMLGLPCYVDSDTGQAVTNKISMKRLLLENGIPTARQFQLESLWDLPQYCYPLVVKPANCNSSKAVSIVTCEEELDAALRVARSASRTSSAIVEEYVEGLEYSIDAVVVNGIAEVLCVSRSDKLSSVPGFVICRGQYVPSVHTRLYSEALELVNKIAAAFGLMNCPLLVQVLEGSDGLKVVELSARTGGCIKYQLIRESSGVDIIDWTTELLLGSISPVLPAMRSEIVSNEFIYAPNGTLCSLGGIEPCLESRWISRAYTFFNAGDSRGQIKSSGDRVAALTIVARNHEEYEWKRKKALNTIRVVGIDGKDLTFREESYDTFNGCACDGREQW